MFQGGPLSSQIVDHAVRGGDMVQDVRDVGYEVFGFFTVVAVIEVLTMSSASSLSYAETQSSFSISFPYFGLTVLNLGVWLRGNTSFLDMRHQESQPTVTKARDLARMLVCHILRAFTRVH